MEMKAKIIRRKPYVRKLTEKSYANGDNEQMLVRFTGNRRQSWIGLFEKEEKQGLCKVLTCANTNLSLVIAGGRGYLVNIENKEMRRVPNDGKKIVSAVNSGRPGYCIAGTETTLCVIDQEGKIHEIVPDFSVEGFYLDEKEVDKARGNLVSEINLYEKEIPFSIDLETYTLHVDY